MTTTTWTDNNSRTWEVISSSEKDTPKGKLVAMVLREISSGTPENLLSFAVGVEAHAATGIVKRRFDVASEQAARDLIAKQFGN